MRPLEQDRDSHGRTVSVHGLNVWKQGRWLLRDVSFNISAGSCVVVAGRNGSGKTTFLRSLAGVLLPTDGWHLSGCLEAGGRRRDLASPVDRLQVSHLSQSLTPTEDLSVREFLQLSESEQLRSRWVEEIFGIPELADCLFSQLSGGQWQRVRLAQCLRKPAEFFLLDEPDAFLDSHARAVLSECILELRKQAKVVFVVLHRPQEAVRLASHWLGFDAGSLMFFESHRGVYPNELMDRLFLGKRLDSSVGVD